MKYVVTGGAGFIGSNIVEELVSRGDEVTIIDDFSTGKKDNLSDFEEKISVVKGSVRDLDFLKNNFPGVDYVLHLAAVASVPQSVADPVYADEVNVRGTLNVLLAARDSGVKRVVLSSSCAVYGDNPVMPKTEDMLPEPMSPYALGKLAGEHYCKIFSKLYDLETVCLRYFNVFGPRQDPSGAYAAVIPIFIDSLLKGSAPTIYGDGLQSRDFIYVKNVVDANLLACTAPGVSGEVFNIGSGEEITLNDLYSQVKTLLGSDIEPVYKDARDGDIKHSRGSIKKACEKLGFEPKISFEDGMKKAVEWYET